MIKSRTLIVWAATIPAPLLLIVALGLLQSGSALAKSIMSPETAFGLVFLRLSIGAIILWVLVRPNLRVLSAAQWRDALLLGVVFLGFNLSVYNALLNLPLGLVATIGFLGPLAVSLGGARRGIDLLWPGLGFLGVAMLAPSTSGSTISWWGIGTGILYAIAWAGYILASSRATKSISGLDGFVIATAIAAFLSIPFGLMQSGQYVSSGTMALLTLIVAVLAILPFGIEFLVLKQLPPRVFGTLLSLEPAIAALAGLAFLGELLSLQSWIAIAAVSVASIGITITRAAP